MRALGFFFSLLLIPVTMLLALLSCLGAFAPYISPITFSLPAFINLSLPLLLLVNLAVFLYWLVQKSRLAFIPIIAILFNFNYILSIFQFNTQSPVSINEKNIRIATYNVGAFRSWEKNDTQTEIAQYIRTQNADIVCLQEYKDIPRLTADSLAAYMGLPYYAINYLSRNGYANYGSAIFSRYPVIAYQKIDIPSETNDAMWADIKIGNDTIRIFNCHLQTTNFNRSQKHLHQQLLNKQPDFQHLFSVYRELKQNFKQRAAQAEIIRQQTDTTPYPIIICGDFNDPPLSYTYHTVKGKLKDSFRENGQGYGYTFRGIKKILRIDFILYSPAFKGIHYQSPPLLWSDHKPVLTDLSLQFNNF